jgi:uncharacterized membrane protein YsdA (DUF1294 family)
MAAARRFSPARFHLVVALGLIGVGTVLLWWLLGAQQSWLRWIVAWLGAVNVVTFGYFGFDKLRARQGASRVPEAVLHGLGGLGGSPGAYAAMQVFRHKTVKGPFRILFWGIVILQTALLVWLAKIAWW